MVERITWSSYICSSNWLSSKGRWFPQRTRDCCSKQVQGWPSSPKILKLPEDLSRIDSDASSEVRIEEIENLVHVKTMLVGVPERESDPASESEKVFCLEDCKLKPSRSKKKGKGVTLNWVGSALCEYEINATVSLQFIPCVPPQGAAHSRTIIWGNIARCVGAMLAHNYGWQVT